MKTALLQLIVAPPPLNAAVPELWLKVPPLIVNVLGKFVVPLLAVNVPAVRLKDVIVSDDAAAVKLPSF